MRLVERLGLSEGDRVLDVGCGTGRLADWIAERVGVNGAVIGIDPLEERIHIARSRGGTARFEAALRHPRATAVMETQRAGTVREELASPDGDQAAMRAV